jgi:hypothetical protein
MKLPTTNKPQPPHFYNAQGFGKAGNNAISVMVATGDFDHGAEAAMERYKEITILFYKADLEAQQQIKKELC